MTNNSGIYKITNLTTNKVYIGQTIKPLKRFNSHKWHLNNNKHCNPYLQSAWNKYGEKDFTFEVLEYILVELLNEREKHYILTFESLNPTKGYNLEIPAFNGPKVFSKESIEKMRKSSTGFRHSQESKLKMSKIKIGNLSRTGLKNSDKVKNLCRERLKGNTIWVGRKHSEETKLKMKLARLGKKFPRNQSHPQGSS